jgi:glycerol-3-phosphate O-acyltransferase
MGAYFVRRRSRNALYRRVLARYVFMATAGGVTQAVYPEGGLSRDGRLGKPKMGLLDYMLRSFEPNGGRDLVFVPVGINYDRVIEDRTLLLDLLPERPKRSAWKTAGSTLAFAARNLLQMLFRRWYRFGYVCVNFGTPVSIRHFMAEHGQRFGALDSEQRFAAVQEVAGTLMGALARVIPVVPVPLVACVFLRNSDKAMSELEVKASAYQLAQELEELGAHVYIPRVDQEYAIVVGLRMLLLRRLVEERDGFFRIRPENESVLRYYANSIVHFWEEPSAYQ